MATETSASGRAEAADSLGAVAGRRLGGALVVIASHTSTSGAGR